MSDEQYNGVAIGVKYHDDKPPTETDEAAAGVIVEALQKLHERNAVHRDLWKDGGCEDSLHHIKHKSARLKNSVEFPDQLHPVDYIDDALDLINYAIFFVLNARADRWKGEEG